MRRPFLAVVLVMSSLHAQTKAPRPRVLGLAHVAFRASELSRTGSFYERILGFAGPFSLAEENGQAAIVIVKVNDQQYVELLQGDDRSQGQFDHFALYTDDLAAMREYLLAQRIPILRDVHQGRVGNAFFTIRDPDGHPMEILQYSPTSLTGQSQGKFMPADRVSNHISHVGVLVRSEGSATKFYRDILGFRELSRDGARGQPGWVDMQVPDGSDYIELLPFADAPSSSDSKARNHLGLATSNVKKTVASLQLRVKNGLLQSPIKVQSGNDLPPRANLLDPDGVRIEMMEPISKGVAGTAVSHP